MSEQDPFRFKSREHEMLFLQRIGEAILETVDLPEDGKWHEVQISFDFFCPLAEGVQQSVRSGQGGFLLGGSNAG